MKCYSEVLRLALHKALRSKKVSKLLVKKILSGSLSMSLFFFSLAQVCVMFIL